MAGTALVRRPTEDVAVGSARLRPVSVSRAADLLIIARATGDREGAVRFDSLLDRAIRGQW